MKKRIIHHEHSWLRRSDDSVVVIDTRGRVWVSEVGKSGMRLLLDAPKPARKPRKKA